MASTGYFGPSHSDNFPLRLFSVTIAIRNGDVSNELINDYKGFVREFAYAALTGIERGYCYNNKLIQSVVEIHCSRDKRAEVEIIKILKLKLSTCTVDGDVSSRKKLIAYV